MERMFICYHGEKSLRPGKGAIRSLSEKIAELVSLPDEVISYFVRCRLFFRIRILNKGNDQSKKLQDKLKKTSEISI